MDDNICNVTITSSGTINFEANNSFSIGFFYSAEL